LRAVWSSISDRFLAPTLATPLIAGAFNLNILPVLVADYLGLHLLIFGGIQLVLLRIWGVAFGRVTWGALLALLVWCILFGVALTDMPQIFGRRLSAS